MATKTRVDVTLCSDEDIPTCFQILSKSFGNDAPFVDAYFPKHETQPGQTQGSARLLIWKQTEKESIFLKAVDAAGKIMGFGVWTHMKEVPPTELEEVDNVQEVWPNEDDRDFMRALWKEYIVPRSQAIREAGDAGIWVLELLAVDPDCQRQGAGTALVEWGTRKADDAGLEAVVEGTPIGRRTYEKAGFETEIEEMKFDVGKRFDGRKKPVLVFLKRTKR